MVVPRNVAGVQDTGGPEVGISIFHELADHQQDLIIVGILLLRGKPDGVLPQLRRTVAAQCSTIGYLVYSG